MTDRRVPTPPSTYTQPSLTTATESLRDLDAYVAEHDGEGGGGGTAATTTFTPAAGIAATDVQAAIEEAVTDAAATYATLTTVLTKTGGGKDTVYALASLTGTIGIDLANGNMHYGTLAGNTTFTFTGATNGSECEFVLSITQDSTPRTITWPASVKWAGGVAPTLSTGSGAIDQFVFRTRDGGTTWYGALIGKGFA